MLNWPQAKLKGFELRYSRLCGVQVLWLKISVVLPANTSTSVYQSLIDTHTENIWISCQCFYLGHNTDITNSSPLYCFVAAENTLLLICSLQMLLPNASDGWFLYWTSQPNLPPHQQHNYARCSINTINIHMQLAAHFIYISNKKLKDGWLNY